MPIQNDHTVKAFDDDLNRLRGLVSDMGGRAEYALRRAMDALQKGDLALAEEVVADDKRIDELELEVERRAVQVIALRAPMADDLREMVAAIKIAGVIERIGDYAKNIAKRVPILAKGRQIDAIPLLMSMADQAGEMVQDALNALAAKDAALAIAVTERDKNVDDFYNSIFRALVTFMMENPRSITEAAHLLFIAKNVERIGDHATNVAEMVHYQVTGEFMLEREKGDDVIGPETEQD
jgi:phosphate transport system protein